MSKIKQCKQCGDLKPLDQYRKYYGGRKGHYNTCKLCEKINSREKYLTAKDALTEEEQAELDKIYKLWDYQTTLGFRPPRKIKATSVADSLDALVDKYATRASAVKEVIADTEAPAELIKWLTEELTEEPEYYQEDVYDELTRKYRPQVRIDPATMLPVYDDTHREVLQKIASRFDEYEDRFYD